ncbi:nitrile hydratase subunit alpha [Ruegeria sp. 2205SS24-7]|uniref:nitrile hydratase subunit alpha n=1 Tax=Ruegeria discodermiae TaxID=3064389 RepID=UPI00274054EC|nr:nitrile hydratase subunit alpha [Ruegeria sp. 2205SS24-7]MDP5215731.1 nitrile hydratase subunit alpha [Ruegeria sp. 2205SS24-7]
MLQQSENATKARFLQKVWRDDAYRRRLKEDPKSALAELGVNVEDGVTIRCVMDSDTVKYLHIPAAPEAGEISDRDLLEAQGGTTPVCVVTVVIVTLGSAYETIAATKGS